MPVFACRRSIGRPSSHSVDNDRTVDTMAVSCVLSEEGRRSVVRPNSDESVITAKPPTAARRIPLDAPADVAREERLGAGDSEIGALIHRQTAHATGDERCDRMTSRGRQHNIAVVGQAVGCLQVRGSVPKVEVLGNSGRATNLTFDADEPVDVVRHGATVRVVPEFRTLPLRGEERRTSRDDRDFDGPRTC